MGAHWVSHEQLMVSALNDPQRHILGGNSAAELAHSLRREVKGGQDGTAGYTSSAIGLNTSPVLVRAGAGRRGHARAAPELRSVAESVTRSACDRPGQQRVPIRTSRDVVWSMVPCVAISGPVNLSTAAFRAPNACVAFARQQRSVRVNTGALAGTTTRPPPRERSGIASHAAPRDVACARCVRGRHVHTAPAPLALRWLCVQARGQCYSGGPLCTLPPDRSKGRQRGSSTQAGAGSRGG